MQTSVKGVVSLAIPACHELPRLHVETPKLKPPAMHMHSAVVGISELIKISNTLSNKLHKTTNRATDVSTFQNATLLA